MLQRKKGKNEYGFSDEAEEVVLRVEMKGPNEGGRGS